MASVFIPSGGGLNILPLIRHLKGSGHKVVVCDGKKTSPVEHFVDRYFVSPPVEDPAYLKFSLDLCQKEQIEVVIPGISADVMFYATHVEKFESIGSVATVSSLEACSNTVDKTKCYELLKANGVSVPEYYEVKNASEFREAASRLGYPNKPFCIKPAKYPTGSGKGFRIIDPKININRRMFWEPTSELYYVSYDSVIAAYEKEENTPPFLVMELLPGEEFSVYALCQNGESLYVIPNLRKKLVLMNSQEAEVVENNEIESLSRKICSIFGFSYNVNVQLKYSTDQVAKVVEINPRLAGTIILPVAAGADLVNWSIDMALGKEIPRNRPIQYGTSIVRYWDQVFLNNKSELVDLK